MSWPCHINPNPPFQTLYPQPRTVEAIQRENERHRQMDARTIAAEQETHAELARRSPTTVTAPRLEIKHFTPRVWEIDIAALESLRAKVLSNGLPADRETLIQIGKKRFQELLRINRRVRDGGRSVGPSLDLSNETRTLETLCGWQMLRTPISGEERLSLKRIPRDEVRVRVARIDSVTDLWKSTEPEIRALCDYYAAFDSLRCGHQLVENYRDGRVYDERFGSLSPNCINYTNFAPWLPAFQASNGQVFLAITLCNLEAATLAWISGDERLAEDARLGADMLPALARNIFNVRRPSSDELRMTKGLLASVLGGDDLDANRSDFLYESWQTCGRAGARMTLGDIAHLRPYLTSRYLRVTKWHREFLDQFLTPVSPYGGYRVEFLKFRRRVEDVSDQTKRAVSGSIALVVEEQLADSRALLVGSIGDRLIIEAPTKVADKLKEKLESSLGQFRDARAIQLPFTVEISQALG